MELDFEMLSCYQEGAWRLPGPAVPDQRGVLRAGDGDRQPALHPDPGHRRPGGARVQAGRPGAQEHGLETGRRGGRLQGRQREVRYMC